MGMRRLVPRGHQSGANRNKTLLLNQLPDIVTASREAIRIALESSKAPALDEMDKAVDVFEVEVLCEDENWEALEVFVKVSLARLGLDELIRRLFAPGNCLATDWIQWRWWQTSHLDTLSVHPIVSLSSGVGSH